MVFKSLAWLVQEQNKYKVPAFLHSHWSIFSSVRSWPAFGTFSRITVVFWNNFQDHRWLSEQFQDHSCFLEQFPGSQMAYGTISRITVVFWTISRITDGFRNNVQDHTWLSEQFPGSQRTFGTILRITDGFRNTVKDHRWFSEQLYRCRRLSESQNKLPKEGFLKGCSHLVKWFHRSKRKLYFIFSSQKDS